MDRRSSFLNFAHKTRQEGLNQFFRFALSRSFSVLTTAIIRSPCITFHLRRRNEIAFLRVDFEEAKPFPSP